MEPFAEWQSRVLEDSPVPDGKALAALLALEKAGACGDAISFAAGKRRFNAFLPTGSLNEINARLFAWKLVRKLKKVRLILHLDRWCTFSVVSKVYSFAPCRHWIRTPFPVGPALPSPSCRPGAMSGIWAEGSLLSPGRLATCAPIKA